MITTPIELELRKLGLTEKEVKVYLAGLGLGPSSVQKIAGIAKITRPTIYKIIKHLEEKGLFIETRQKGKRLLIAQSPERILGILRTQKREIEEKEREFIRIIATIEAKYSKGKEGIKVFNGKEGLEALEETLSFTPLPEINIISSKTNFKEIKKRYLIYQKIKKRLGRIEVKEIYPERVSSKFPQVQIKILSPVYLGGTLILFDKAIFLSEKKQEGVLIENRVIIDLFRSLFNTIWEII